MTEAKLRELLEVFEPTRERIIAIRKVENELNKDGEMRDLFDGLGYLASSVDLSKIIQILFEFPKDNSSDYFHLWQAGKTPDNSPELFKDFVCHDWLSDFTYDWECGDITTDKLIEEVMMYVNYLKDKKKWLQE